MGMAIIIVTSPECAFQDSTRYVMDRDCLMLLSLS